MGHHGIFAIVVVPSCRKAGAESIPEEIEYHVDGLGEVVKRDTGLHKTIKDGSRA